MTTPDSPHHRQDVADSRCDPRGWNDATDDIREQQRLIRIMSEHKRLAKRAGRSPLHNQLLASLELEVVDG